MKNRTGEFHINNEGYEIEIVSYISNRKCIGRFSNGFVFTTTYQNIKNGAIRNPYHLSVYGTGYFGYGQYKSRLFGKMSKEYDIWHSMMSRGYCKIYKGKFPSYKDVTVCVEWHNFQVFAKWFEGNYIEDFQLDKDILVKNNKVYSPETCCFVPHEINSLLINCKGTRGILPIGVVLHSNKFQCKNIDGRYLGTFNTIEEAFQAYKTAKEIYIKEVADKYKNQITEQTYQALYNYQVEIID